MTAATLAEALAEAERTIDRIDARALLAYVLDRDAAFLISHRDDALDEAASIAYRELVARRAGGEPVPYLTGRREFFGREFHVGPSVLIPRPETELLVELALARIPADSSVHVLDLGTGSGCIGITLALERPRLHATCVDRSVAALNVARANAARLGVDNVTFVESDWYAALGGAPFDLIVSNPPYVRDGDPHLARGDLRYEPRAALVGGADGFAAIRAIAEGAPKHARRGGWMLFEHGYDQGHAARALLERLGYERIFSAPDLAGIERVTGGVLRG